MSAILFDPFVAIIVQESDPIPDIESPELLMLPELKLGFFDPIPPGLIRVSSETKRGIIRCSPSQTEKVFPVLDAIIVYSDWSQIERGLESVMMPPSGSMGATVSWNPSL